MIRPAVVVVVMSLAALGAAHAQAIGQQPGTLSPAYPVPAPPPSPVAPPPVPSYVTPLPSPSYGVPRGVTSPSYGSSGVTPSIRYRQPPKRHKKRRPRTSEIGFIRTV